MKATIKDVAKLAGVSFKTVSRVINNEPTVGQALQEKVWEAVKRLNYQPNLSARHLRGRPSSIGYLYDNPNSHYVIDIQHGILEECRRQGYELVIHPCNAKSPDLVEEVAAMIRRSQVAGLVLTPPLSEMDSVVKTLLEQKVAFVRILSGTAVPDELSPCVYIDDHHAAMDITQHLIDLGHQHIGFLGGDEAHKSSIERLNGYQEALKKNGLEVEPRLILEGEYSFESGVQRTKQLLREARKPSAIFACNDEIAAGTLFAARLMGITVPQELSIVGFEDSPFSRQTWPKLTTARQPNSTIAQAATALLIDRMKSDRQGAESGDETLQNGFHPKLVIRDSTCPVPADI
ncbi:LacI family transcriptional regulator [Exilibacterium tricleocarpae]|uniref:LacI family transcriptional regulator n=1 Tax=Exilibacterium tricleocarpae TaxID=2591008 RepID=A0A545TP06_9GAMM|nr:LacI family DNA-binding transcriptional regulator [Exilibacterium tricleocarpae]TQV78918.1 LacI family transcriptional regulator [Exilibacterium tricleocarpae]